MDQRCLSFHVALEWNLSQAIKELILDFCEVCSSSSPFGREKVSRPANRETHLVHDFEDVLELLEALARGDGEDEDEGVALGYGESLHGGELVRARRVRDLEGAYRVVGRDYLKRNQCWNFEFKDLVS